MQTKQVFFFLIQNSGLEVLCKLTQPVIANLTPFNFQIIKSNRQPDFDTLPDRFLYFLVIRWGLNPIFKKHPLAREPIQRN